jgi:hypothetical protein
MPMNLKHDYFVSQIMHLLLNHETLLRCRTAQTPHNHLATTLKKTSHLSPREEKTKNIPKAHENFR